MTDSRVCSFPGLFQNLRQVIASNRGKLLVQVSILDYKVNVRSEEPHPIVGAKGAPGSAGRDETNWKRIAVSYPELGESWLGVYSSISGGE